MKRFIGLALLIACSSVANAAIITWKIDGVITSGSGGSTWTGGASSGDSFEVLVTFNDASPGTPHGDSSVAYNSTIQSLQMTINGHTEVMTVDGLAGPNGFEDERRIVVGNDSEVAGQPQDGFYIDNRDRMESIVTPGENRHEYLHVYWGDRRPLAEGSSMLNSTELLSSPDVLSTANYSHQMAWGFSDFGTDPYTGVQLLGNIVSASVIPVPAAFWLFASGLGLLGWRRKHAGT
ncbi:MAG: hypothetical protein ACR2P6_11250 [Gammaproteobacteria bacterium]